MARCAYCLRESTESLTKEHIIPRSFLVITPGRKTFSKKAQKILPSEMTIRDTCAACNNGVLGRLDAAAISNLRPHISSWYRDAPPQIRLSLSRELLARWLLKVCFNMARVTQADDLPALAAQRSFILTETPRPARLHVFAGIIRSVHLTAAEQEQYDCPLEWLDPEFVRITLWRDPRVLRHLSIGRGVFLDAMGFLVVKLHKGASVQQVTQFIHDKMGFVPLSANATDHTLRPSKLDAATSNEVSLMANAQVYLDHMSEEQRDRILYPRGPQRDIMPFVMDAPAAPDRKSSNTWHENQANLLLDLTATIAAQGVLRPPCSLGMSAAQQRVGRVRKRALGAGET